MKEIVQKTLKKSRRSFLSKGAIAGSALLLGVNPAVANNENKEEKVKLMTADGQLVEVVKKYLPQNSGKKISTQELFAWKKIDKN